MLRKYVFDPIWHFTPVAVWGVCLLTLVALLLGAVFGFFAQEPADEVPADSWARISDSDRFWEPMLNNIGFDRAIKLIETKVPAKEKGRALHQLLVPNGVRRATAVDLLQAPPLGSTPEQIEARNQEALETQRQYEATRLAELKEIRRVLDTLDESPERVSDYATLAGAFDAIGAEVESESAYTKLAEQIERMGGRMERIKEWFLPLLNEHIALTVCGIMALVLYLLRPTVEVWAKAIAYQFHGRNVDPHIQRALGNESKPRPELYKPD